MREPEGARFLFRLAKSARKHWCGLTVVTQDAADVLGTDLGRAVVSNASTQITLQAELVQGFTAPGLVQQRTTEKDTAASTAAVTAIRDLGGTSITFLVTAHQDTTIAGAEQHATWNYAVTVIMSGGIWKVYAIEPAAAGQSGSMP